MSNQYTYNSFLEFNLQCKTILPMDILEIINETIIINNVLNTDKGSLDYAALQNNLKLLKLYQKYNLPHTNLAFDYACANGNYEMVLYLHNNGFKGSEQVMNIASKKGHLHIVKWLNKNSYVCSIDVLFFAEINNHIDIVTYICKNIKNLECSKIDLIKAMNCGNFQIIQYIFNKVFNDNKNFIKYAVINGHATTMIFIKNLILNYDNDMII